MTPSQLRARARMNLRSAEQLLLGGDADNAAQLAGSAAELALKARYCTRKKILDFPDSLFSLKAAGLGDLATHDLEKLLTLCEGHRIAQSNSINWGSISAWRIHHRYQPIGTLSIETTKAQIDATKILLRDLALFETIEGLLLLREKLESVRGKRFDVFAIERKGPDDWQLIMGAPWLASEIMRHYSRRLISEASILIPQDLVDICKTAVRLVPQDPRLHAFTVLQNMFQGLVRVDDTFAYGHIIESAYLLHGTVSDIPNRPMITSCVFH